MKKQSFILSTAMAVSLSAALFADDGMGKDRLLFADLDIDGNGFVTAEEVAALKAEHFAQIDTDGNGEVTAEELIAYRDNEHEGRINNKIDKLDTDGSGGLSQEELNAKGDRAQKMFDHLDEDGDGAVSEDEFDQGTANRPGRGEGHNGHKGGKGKNGGKGHKGNRP